MPCEQTAKNEKIQCDETFLHDIIKLFGEVIQVNENRVKNIVIASEEFTDFNAKEFDWQMTESGIASDIFNKTQTLQVFFTLTSETDKLENVASEKVKKKMNSN